ncbi:MAG: 50S ribosomal protein L35 [Actinomycetota bacterium]
MATKAKVRKSAAKRFKITCSGRIMRRRAFKGHLLEKKTSKRKRKLGKKAILTPMARKAVERMLSI